MEINESDKVNILLVSLQERYNATHNIRARVEQVCTWALGILVVAAGFIINKDIQLSVSQKSFLIVSLLAILIVLRFFYFRDLEKGFKDQLKVAAKIEKSLLLYEPGIYGEDALFSKSWKNAGQKKSDGRFFRSNYLMLYIGLAIIVGTIILA